MTAPKASDLIKSAGLQYQGTANAATLPSIMTAWGKIIHPDVEPTMRVSTSKNSYLSEVSEKWHAECVRADIFSEEGSFLLSVGGGAVGLDKWHMVKLQGVPRIAEEIRPNGSDPEFIALSSDGRNMCGVTTEEYDIWIVSATI